MGRLTSGAYPSRSCMSRHLPTVRKTSVDEGSLDQYLREISAYQKGRHTTTVRQLFPLEGGGYVADTPGMRSLALWDTKPEELDGYFPDLSPLVSQCQFSDCTHKTEPGCAVRAAVEAGKVRPERYDSYLRLRAGEE